MPSQSSKRKYVFFISHSTEDLKSDVGEICEILETCKIPSFVADRDAPLGNPLPEEIKKAIEESELFLVFITKKSRNSAWVNQEIGFALGRGIPVIPIKKGQIKVKGLIESARYVKMRADPLETVSEIFSKLKNKQLSPVAQAAILAFVGALELKERYGVGK